MDERKAEVKCEPDYDVDEFKIESFDIEDDEQTLSDCSDSVVEVEEEIDEMWKSAESETRKPDVEIDFGDFKTTFIGWGNVESPRDGTLNNSEDDVVEVGTNEMKSSAADKDGDRCYKCSFCQRSYTRKCGLISHQRIAHVDVQKRLERYKGRVRRVGLKKNAQHENNRETERVNCGICSLPFDSDRLLKKHLRFHRSVSITVGAQSAGSVACTLNNADCRQNDKLVTYMFEHTSKADYRCLKCDMFHSIECLQNVECLQRHVLDTHNCAVSEGVLESSRDQEQHEESCNSLPKKMVQCPLCKKTFDADSLRVHSLAHSHEKPLRCDYCNVAFISATYFFKHLREVPGTCDFKTGRPPATLEAEC